MDYFFFTILASLLLLIAGFGLCTVFVDNISDDLTFYTLVRLAVSLVLIVCGMGILFALLVTTNGATS